jgi:myo-inositol-1(or 4)-monophosphatase
LPESDLALLTEAAEAAGRIAERHFNASPEVWDKGDGQGPVTEADLEIDRMLRSELCTARPDYGWLSEETTDSAARLENERVFIVDPIDGTRSFIERSKTFAHSLAIVENGRAVAGVVHLPLRGMTFTARLGGGAFLNGKRISASGREGLTGARILAARPQLAPDLWPGGVPDIDRHFRPSLAYRLCLVAEGRFDGMITLRDAWEWDIAAGALICAEAGAVISDRAGVPLRYNNPTPKHPGVLVGASGVHAGFLRHLKS